MPFGGRPPHHPVATKRIWIVGLAVLTTSCRGAEASQKSDVATQRFFAQVTAKQYQQVYDETAPEFKSSTSAQLFVGMMQRIDRRLGACQAPVKNANWRVNATTNGYFQSQGYTRSCANGKLDETVTTVVRGGEAKVVGYNANSPRLMTD